MSQVPPTTSQKYVVSSDTMKPQKPHHRKWISRTAKHDSKSSVIFKKILPPSEEERRPTPIPEEPEMIGEPEVPKKPEIFILYQGKKNE